ncbi:Glycosyltransferase like family 2 [Mycolicibacterium rutilum]|uniref:Glycosyltransferase like family 2 n=1 Tax=Mycolicibacterium rutilum TaxID=370526 RepID=A0A1H6LLS9_MYCRU|nr:glycosyltransferase family 2 protein [Mycolicibacterium rutilum]SEH85807.1 Glycosyltransferase like family 2 [Mycolicibacterium rutilum]
MPPARVAETLRALVVTGSTLACAGTAHQIVNLCLLRRPPEHPPPVTAGVSILVPARDEAHRIAPTIRSLLAQRGLSDAEIVVLDDGSTDGTADVVRAAAGSDPRVTVLTGAEPPPGWLGKPHACAQLAAAARGEILVFVDADVVLAPHAVAAAVAVLRGPRPLDLLSPWPRQITSGAAARLVQPLLAWSWLTTLPLRLAERSRRPSMAAANGQFLLVEADALARAGGWRSVAGAVLDDISLARAVRTSGGRTGLADGSRLATCRMYASGRELRDGYRKSLWAAFGSPVGAVAVGAALAVVYVLPAAAAVTGSRVGALGYSAAVVGRILAAPWCGRWWDGVAHPVSVLTLLGLLASSWSGRRRGALQWKGRPV